MADIRPVDLPPAASVPTDAAIIVDNGLAVEKATPLQVMDAARPLASQVDAETGADNAKIMSSLRVKQAITAATPFLLNRENHTGTQDISTVTGLEDALDDKEPTVTAGTTSQYYRGDKSWQTLDKAAVGLGNVDNTNDVGKPVSTAQQAALDLKVSLTTLALTSGAGLSGFSHVPTYGAATVGKKLQQQANPLDAPYSATGNGATNDSTALFNADAAGPIVITANHRVSSNLTFTNPVTFVGNGRLTIDSGATVTFNYQPTAPLQRVFFGSGTVAGIKDFQAEWITDANDSTDDTTSLQKAITCVGTGGTLRMGPKTWKITAALTFASDQVRVVGSGRKATKIKQYTVSAGALSITGAYFSVSALSVEYNSQATSGGVGLDFNAAVYSTIDELHVFKSYVGVRYRAAANSHTGKRIFIEDATQSSVHVLNSPNVVWSEFQLINSNTTTLGMLGCIRLEGAGTEGCNFFNGHTHQGVYALATAAASYAFGQIPAYNKFHGVYFDGATGAVVDKAAEIDFVDCWFSQRPSCGLYIGEVDGVRFSGGGAINCGQEGLVLDAAAKRVTINNFAARSNSTTASNTYSGISVSAGTTDFVIQGCTCTNSSLSFGTQKNGIEVKAGASDRYVIKNNLIGGNGTAGVVDGGTGVNKAVGENY